MRIGLDFRPAQKINSRRRGVGRFTRELIRALVESPGDHEFLLYTMAGVPTGLDGRYRVRPLVHLPKPSRFNWILELWLFPRAARRDRLDLFHAPDLLPMPRITACPVWVTIHDLIPWIFPEEYALGTPRDFRYALDRALDRARQADRILTVSEHSKQDICKRLGLPAERVTVIPEGCERGPGPCPPEVARALVRHQLGISGPFLFYVGGTDYRKNLFALLEGFRRICASGYQGSLVLAGETTDPRFPEAARLAELARRMGIGDRLRMLGFLPDELLAAAYSACDFFVFPSLYEGFGLPVLEAMRCGAAVLAANSSAIPEVAGEAAFYFDPTSVESLVDAYREAADQPDLVEEKRRHGLERAQRFTWKAAAERLLSLYRQELESRKS
jgi:glycosyltransferase involved in cell wall biosynthesis